MPRWPDTSPVVGEDGWTEQYGTYSRRVGMFRLSVSWSTDRQRPGYLVAFGDARLKEPIADLREAKAVALRLARKKLTEAVAALPADAEAGKETTK